VLKSRVGSFCGLFFLGVLPAFSLETAAPTMLRLLAPAAGATLRGAVILEWENLAPTAIFFDRSGGEFSVAILAPIEKKSPDVFQVSVPSRLLVPGDYQVRFIMPGGEALRSHEFRVEPLRQLLVLGSRSVAPASEVDRARETRSSAIFERLSRETRWGLLNATGLWGRFTSEKVVKNSLEKLAKADLALVIADLIPVAGSPLRFLIADSAAGEPSFLAPADLQGLRSNAFFIFMAPTGVDAGGLSSQLAEAGLKHLVCIRPEKMGEIFGEWFSERRGSLSPARPWLDLGDLARMLEPHAVGPGPGDLGPCPVRAWRWANGSSVTNIDSRPIISEITNESSITLVTRNLVVYEGLISGAIRKVQSGLLQVTNIIVTEGRWEDPAP
jgi:hypothetical protein